MNHLILKELCDTLSDDSDFSTSSSSESEGCKRKKGKEITKIHFFVEETVLHYSDNTFQSHFRMSRTIAYRLIDRLKNSSFIKMNSGPNIINCEKAFLLTLWYVANTETFRQISDRFDVSLSSAHRCLIRVFNFLLSLTKEFIKWPSKTQAEEISLEFRKKQGIKNVIGAIDGCHVKIPRPKKDQESYFNRKSFHSLLIQGIVDHNKKFIDVFCGEPGSIHDARLLRKSSIYSKAQDANFFEEKYLLGDSAYPSFHWLVTPFKDDGKLTPAKKQFNFKHSSTRIIVENAFGLLKGRFRRLIHLDNINILVSVKCIMVCCILHNICIIENDDTTISIPDISTDLISNYSINVDSNNARRQQIMNELCNEL